MLLNMSKKKNAPKNDIQVEDLVEIITIMWPNLRRDRTKMPLTWAMRRKRDCFTKYSKDAAAALMCREKRHKMKR